MSEQDYTLFSMASASTFQIWSAMMHGWEESISTSIESSAEKIAEEWLSRIVHTSKFFEPLLSETCITVIYKKRAMCVSFVS